MWHDAPVAGTAGRIHMGLDSNLFDIIGFIARRFPIMATATNKLDGLKWYLVVVYGPAYAELKLDFIIELYDIMDHASLTICIGGYFKLVRRKRIKTSCY